MSIQLIYQVLNRQGKVFGEYQDKKVAAAVDHRLETIYDLSAKLIEAMPQATEAERDAVAEYLVDNREQVVSMLKSVKEPADLEKDKPAVGLVDPVDPVSSVQGDGQQGDNSQGQEGTDKAPALGDAELSADETSA
ncbi:hypothetical protein D3C87_347720 [compost metagenome]